MGKGIWILVVFVCLVLPACAGGTRGTGALLDRRLMDNMPEEKKPKEKPLFNRWFGSECDKETENCD